jgi:hypothetical protein
MNNTLERQKWACASRIQLKGVIQSAEGILPLEIAECRHESECCVRVSKRQPGHFSARVPQ